MAFVRANDEAKINAYFGSRREWETIGDWSTFRPPQADRTPHLLDHGYDEAKDATGWNSADMIEAAAFRGGRLLSTTMTTGDISTPLRWKCALDHTFTGSPRLILTAGHWCPVCVNDPGGYPHQAERNHFLAQLERQPPGALTA
jgi:hypothetical protein